ncbi:protein ACCELERATED CELL DEATH 6-like isoform X1 [Hibiscus syriacus]|uniref:protein ACCELERATED CELL DEATH 6-like isoform X1 n=1 Tax=Hibiscus syriacus TaxID=106335 RepID=UPI0019224739|nr:protein ACCELERATED CELL DEATH 6-like isoform X1 [Hibiscus syriacus]
MAFFAEMSDPYAKVMENDAQGLKIIYENNRNALFNRINACGDTIFHIAAYNGRNEPLQVMLKLVPQSRKRELMMMKNGFGNTILHEAATTTNVRAADLLIRELLLFHENDIRQREEILAARNKLGETPLFRAAEYSNKTMVVYLAREIERGGNLMSHYKRNDGTSILHIAVIGQHFDTAIWFLKKDPQLATYRDKHGKTSLHVLAGISSAFKSSSPIRGIFKGSFYNCLHSGASHEDEIDELPLNLQSKDLEQGRPSKALNQSELFKGWKMIDGIRAEKRMHESAVKLAKILVRTDSSWFDTHEPVEEDTVCLERMEEEKVKSSAAPDVESPPEPDTPLFTAARAGIVEVVTEILTVYPQAIDHINRKGQNVLHVAIMHRQYKVYDVLRDKEEAKRLVRGIDNHGCTILHRAADTKFYHGGTKPTPPLKLQQELIWFEQVKAQMPPHFIMHINQKGKTADELFKDMHRGQLKVAQNWVKNTSQSCSTVAILVATVVFTAAYTVPGGFLQTDGRPILLEKPLYSFFTVMDVAGLASSLTSVVVFLSILTSSLEFGDFHHRLPRNLSLGFTFLFFSVTSTMLTFMATILLLVHLQKKWTATLTYAAAFLPIGVFALFQFPLYYQYFMAAVKSILDFLRKNLPGDWDFLEIKDD